MEKLSPELLDMAIKNNKIFMPYDDENILLYKNFTVPDEEVDSYVQKVNSLIDKGIKTPRIKDYKLVTLSPKSKYSKYVILEEKAPGCNIDHKGVYLSTKKSDIDFEQAALEYISYLDEYINEISLRAEASVQMYIKLVQDYLAIVSTGLQIDPKPLNFFFDKEEGFTFIDINGGGKDDLEKYLPRYILGCTLSYGLPSLSIDYKPYNYIDEERMAKLKEALSKIISKIAVALMSKGYSKEMVIEDAKNWTNQLDNYQKIDHIEDLSNTIATEFAKLKEAQKSKVEEVDWTIGW